MITMGPLLFFHRNLGSPLPGATSPAVSMAEETVILLRLQIIYKARSRVLLNLVVCHHGVTLNIN